MRSCNLNETVERSASLGERLAHCVLADDAAIDASIGHALRASRLGNWQRISAKGDGAAFIRRLSWLGKTPADVAPLLGRVHFAERHVLPPWVDFIRAFFDQEHVPCGAYETTDIECGLLPFAHVLLPLADFTDRTLDVAASDALSCFTANARASLRSQLLARLSRLAAPVLYTKFSASHAYDAFARDMRAGGFERLLCDEYCVLCRLLGVTTLSWIETTAELARRITADAAIIADALNSGNDTGAVTSAEAGLSDPHDGGRTVIALEFESGLRVIYKPRALSAEMMFGNVVAFVNSTRDAPTLKVPRVIDCGDHGWEECVVAGPCNDASEVAEYYSRGGALLALVTALGGLDLHYENIIACGAWPVPIDLETVFQPHVSRGDPPAGVPPRANAGWLFQNSVLRTGLLPIWQQGANDAVFDCGGLTGTGAEPTRFQTARWSHSNTDAMALEYGITSTPTRENLPVLDGRPQSGETHIESILDGFTRMYRALMHSRDALLHDDGPLAAANVAQVRFLVRPSNVYDTILRQSLAPEALRDGVDRSIRLDALARGMLVTDTTLRELLPAEIAALERLDIPSFRTSIDDTSLGEDGHFAAGCFSASARTTMLRGLEALDERDLQIQQALIRTSFGLRYPNIAGRGISVRDAQHIATSSIDPAPDALMIPRIIAQEVAARAIRASDGSSTWFRLEPLSASGDGRIREMTPGLYAGTAGVALFLASFARIASDDSARALALSALHPLCDADAIARHAQLRGIGLAEGVAGVAYALAHCGRELQNERLIDFAEIAAESITPQAVSKDNQLDVLYGAAGAALALLSLYRTRPSDDLIERARFCGRHLVAQREATHAGPRAWRTLGARMTGMSHGSSGIALALSRIYEATGEPMFLDAALEAIAYEDTQFDETAGNWADLRSQRTTADVHHQGESWCHGAPGILLARLGGIGNRTDAVDSNLDKALATVRGFGIERPDSICCGNFGIVDTLLTAGVSLGRQDVIAAAYERSAAVLERAACSGFRSSLRAAPGTIDQTFFQGTAGIGYTLLRLAHPSELPSILTFDGGEEVSGPEPGRVPCGRILSAI